MKKIIYCDMDGVLADFNAEPQATRRYLIENDFFEKLKPIQNNVNALNNLIENKNTKVYILSASPNKCGDNSKLTWLKKYLPELKRENIILMRCGENKADFVKKVNNAQIILFDDWSKNCNDFINCGFNAYKIDKWHTIKRGISKYLA